MLPDPAEFYKEMRARAAKMRRDQSARQKRLDAEYTLRRKQFEDEHLRELMAIAALPVPDGDG